MASSTTNVITRQRRIYLAQISRGAIETIPKITHIAFGDGGVGEDGQPLQRFHLLMFYLWQGTAICGVGGNKFLAFSQFHSG